MPVRFPSPALGTSHSQGATCPIDEHAVTGECDASGLSDPLLLRWGVVMDAGGGHGGGGFDGHGGHHGGGHHHGGGADGGGGAYSPDDLKGGLGYSRGCCT